MKKLSFLVVLVMISLSALAQTTVKLPAPDKQVAMTLYEALQTRHSVRSYQNKDVTMPRWLRCYGRRVATVARRRRR